MAELKSLFEGLMTPHFDEIETDIPNYISSPSARSFIIEEEVKERLDPESDAGTAPTGVRIPLTRAQADAVDGRVDQTLDRIDSMLDSINNVQSKIDKQIEPSLSHEYSLSLELDRKPRIKRAIRKLFGFKTTTITYDMYKQLLKAKVVLESQEAAGYIKGYDS